MTSCEPLVPFAHDRGQFALDFASRLAALVADQIEVRFVAMRTPLGC